ncbi:phage antirepressor N-terminal domain-containing protein [Intestinimonas butyriciproducens]|uniref:P22-like antirepressor protein n=1 Tax=Intestinimonas butyriciproducens TaxID=1297617 RepID=A0A2U1BF80_9FIRM|nr:phage antirepressor N-terminal domain-containing protein [Intestinimonas butyriciproducens]MBU5230021.1 phage antirepressor N-terminal domain-containing protein [Intestinimonas butyriciproducens]MCR1907368.1 phage antirepressor N-terminal domain-containing protein [Intestinimonas butyriciproducens]MDB7830840.1 phage antirepressor N-terminal domain-containing protein [Intestinimonas butyriciproducens]PVY47332.1 P22-like antirepressor protein [Intestinimonas butyriciproducens]QBB66305.1 hypot
MNELEIKTVPFMGTELMAARDNDGQIWAGVRWMCDGLGLSEGQRKRQIANIQADKVLSKGGSNLVLPTRGGNQEVLCLKLDFVPLWLAKIGITPTMEAETPELAANLEQYQLRAKDVLAAAFLPVSAVPDLDALSPTLRVLINLELKQREQDKAIEAVNQKVDDIRDVVALSPNSWRPDARSLIARIARALGGNEYIRDVQAEIFKLVDERARVSLETRLTNKRRRMADEGVCKSRRDKLTKVDVIADDAKLIEIYIAVVKEMCVKYGIAVNEETIDGKRD